MSSGALLSAGGGEGGARENGAPAATGFAGHSNGHTGHGVHGVERRRAQEGYIHDDEDATSMTASEHVSTRARCPPSRDCLFSRGLCVVQLQPAQDLSRHRDASGMLRS
ncbi:hypothetical protein MRX96_032214 [Rhipicephalus microplus]